MFNLVLGVKRKRSRLNDARTPQADRAFETVRDEILRRDAMTCQGCGFSSVSTRERPSGGLEVHHIDDNHTNNRKENLITLCPFCHMVFSLGRRGRAFMADLIWMPEIEQREINLLAHEVAFFSWVEKTFRNESAKADSPVGIWLGQNTPDFAKNQEIFNKVYLKVVARWRTLYRIGQERLNRVFSDSLAGLEVPENCYHILLMMETKEYKKRDRLLHGVRLLPRIHHEQFADVIGFWAINLWMRRARPSDWVHFAAAPQPAVEESLSE